MDRSWQLRGRLVVLVVITCVLAGTGCSIVGAGSPSLTQRCERSLPALDTTAALVATLLAFTLDSSSDGEQGGDAVNGRALGAGVVFGLSAAVGYTKAGQCRRRDVPVDIRDRFLGARQWATSVALVRTETPVVALERAYQRAAVVCEGRGFSAQRSTPLAPWRPRWITLVYKCH